MAELRGLGTVFFRVYDIVSLKSIVGAEVKAGSFTGLTDGQGLVSFTGYPLGPQITVVVTHPEYDSKTIGVIINTDGATIGVPLNPKQGAPPPVVKFGLIVTASRGGSTTPAPGSYVYDANTTVTETAIPEPGYELVRWELDGVVKPAASLIAVVMTEDFVLNAVFELGAPPAPPPIPGKGSLKVTVLESAQGTPLASATVSLDALTAYSDAAGVARISPVDPGEHVLSVSLAGYDTKTSTLGFGEGQVREETVSLVKKALFDPWGALTAALGGIWDLFLGAMTRFGQGLLAPLQGQAKNLLSQAQTALSTGSPDKETEEKAKKLAETSRRRQEELIREMYKGSPDLNLAPGVGNALMTLFLGTEVSLELIGIGLDITHPMKAVGARRLAERITDSLGTGTLTSDIATMPARVGLLPQLAYWYNKQFTPLIPGLQDLITMLVREVITPEQYVDLASMQGESKIWADRRWETHWRLPSPDYLIDSYHRGNISKAELDKFIVWHDYRPGPRPGVSKSDLEIMGGIFKALIPRVDLRRGWAIGLVSDEDLVERYRWLGYEDDAELMAEIQKNAALESDRGAVARAAGRRFRDQRMTEKDFRDVLERVRIVGERQDLWIARYVLERTAKPSASEEAAEEIPAGVSLEELLG